MKTRLSLIICLSLALALNLSATTRYVSANNPHPAIPYTNWATAATNIQDVLGFSSSGDIVLVTNGLYQYGGNFISGTNRIAVPINVTVQSVNGPQVTVIKGYQVPGTINGQSAVRCAYLQTGAVLSGFTLTNGATLTSGNVFGGGVYCASSSCLVSNCIIVGNAAYGGGGGAYAGGYVNCAIIGNSAGTGGGVYGGAPVTAIFCPLINCLLANNFATNYGAAALYGTLINCTVVSNVTAYSGGGSMGACALANSIVYYNFSGYTNADINNGGSMTNYFTNCCASPSLSAPGLNNFTNIPSFVNLAGGNFHLQIGSLCINAGANAYVTNGTDFDGNPRIVGGVVDLGIYENQNTTPVHYVSLTSTNPVSPFTNWSTASTNIQTAVGAAQTGDIVVAADGVYNFGSTIIYGAEPNRVALTNGITLQSLDGPNATAIAAVSMRCVYVGSNSVLNGFTLANGATRSSGDPVKEESGGGAWCETSGVVSNCVFGGTGFPYANNESPADYCTSSYEGAGVYGGTIYNSTFIGNTSFIGGGAAVATLSGCILWSNVATGTGNMYGGGGAYQCMVSNCTFTGNHVLSGYGGAAWGGTLYNSVLSSNAAGYGGGAYFSTLYGCMLSSNSASVYGGGVEQGTLYNCHLAANSAVNPSYGDGGGADQSFLYNCILNGNVAEVGGGAYNSTLYNCTVISNTAVGTAGIQSSSAYNSILYDNINPGNNVENYNGSTLAYCDASPLSAGAGNITNDPALVNLSGGDFHLQSNSPCINSGNNAYVTTNLDFNGNPRIVAGTVDIGAYEFQTPASVLSYAWAQQYGLPTDGSADYADADGDGMNNYQEWRAGTNPDDPNSRLQMLTPANTNNLSGITVSWSSVTNRSYYIQRSLGLGVPPDFSTLQSNLVGQIGTTSYTDVTATNAGPFFYRVGVQ